MESRKLRHFLAVCGYGSMRRAADYCNVTQSALSRSLSALADELGTTLFDRQGRLLRLTPFGETLRRSAERVLLEESTLKRELQLMHHGEVGSCSVGFTPTPAEIAMPPCIEMLARNHPRVRVQMIVGRTDQLISGLRRENYDLVIVDESAIDDCDGLHVDSLPVVHGGFVCRAGHPISSKKFADIDTLCRFPVACSPLSAHFARSLVASFGARAHPDELVTIMCDSFGALRSVVLNSDVILLTAHAIVSEDLASGRIVRVKVRPSAQLKGRYATVRLAGRTRSPVLDHLSQLLRQVMQDVRPR